MPRSGRSKRARRSSKRKLSPAGSESEHDNAAPSSSCAPGTGSLSFDAFLAMPEEIRSLILELAYSRPSSSNNASGPSGASINDLDAVNTINLACASRWFNVKATLRLYTHVAITRPSSLASLQRTISNRPQLGRLIKSLHIGAWDPLPESWWPLQMREGYTDAEGKEHPPTALFSTSLSSPKDASLLPLGYTPGHQYPYEQPDQDPRSIAISLALVAAGGFLGTNLRDMNQWRLPHLPKQPLFQIQAALDLYLMAVRRLEDANNARAGPSQLRSRHDESLDYPALLIAEGSTIPTLADSAARPCIITRQQLLEHLKRPGAPIDRFDHPLLFARSGLDYPYATQRKSKSLNRWEPSDEFVREPEDLADVFQSKPGLEHPASNARISPDVLDPSLSSTATVGGILSLTRSLLALTPRLENLSLTGFLERAVCGRRPTASLLKSLRCLSIGPPPETSQWYVPLRFDGLEEIQKLRVCGVMLRGDEVAQISGRYTELQWSLADQLPEEESKSLGVLVDHLAGRKGMAPDKALHDLGFTALRNLRLPFSYSAAQREPPEPDNDRQSTAKLTNGPLVEMRVRPEVYDALLDRAASDVECEAWETGHSRPHQGRRLLLDVLPVDGNADADETRALYQDGKEWWVRHQNLGEPRYQSHQRWPYY